VETLGQILREAEALDAAEGVGLVHDFLHSLVAENEQQFRLFLRVSMEQRIQSNGKFDTPLRGARRIPMLSLALEPYQEELDDETYEKLLYALSTMVSLEPFIALSDVCQIEPYKGREVTRWAVKVLVNAVFESK